MRGMVWCLLAISILGIVGSTFFVPRDGATTPSRESAPPVPERGIPIAPRLDAAAPDSARVELSANVATVPSETRAETSIARERATWLSGRVLDAATNEPIAGARVRIAGDPGAPPRATATTDARGVYRTNDFVRANVAEDVVVVAPDTIPQRFDGVPVRVGAVERDFLVERNGVLTALVLDVETLAPVAGATVRAEVSPEEDEVAVTDAEGRATIRGAGRAGLAFTLSARKPGYFGTRRFLESPLARAGAQLEFRVGRECRIEAIALDAAGSPNGGSLLLELTTLFSSRQLVAALPVSLPAGLDLEYRWTTARVLDDSGRAVFGELPPLPVARVWLRVDDRIRRSVAVSPFTACGQTRRVDFSTAEIRDPTKIVGRLTMNGAPAKAEATWEIAGARSAIALVADESGEYRIDDVPPGVVTLTMVASATGERRTIEIAVGVGQTVRADFDFLRDGTRIAGRVVDEVGIPLPAAAILAVPHGRRDVAARLATTTDSLGRFELRGLEDGAWYWVEASASGVSTRGVQTESGRVGIEIRLPPAAK